MAALALNPTKGRFLHVIPDEKFIDAIHGILEDAAPGAHDYILISQNTGLRYIRSFEPARMKPNQMADLGVISSLEDYSAVFIHYLSNEARLLVNNAGPQARLIWLAWGADYHHLLSSMDDLLLPKTRAMLTDVKASGRSKLFGLLNQVKNAAVHPLQTLGRWELKWQIRDIGASAPGEAALLRKFSAIATPIEDDYFTMRARCPELDIPFLDWNYWTDGFFSSELPTQPTGKNILLGNSATPTNNHIDALETLADVLPANRQVICPLSYGSPHYGDLIERKGYELLGDRFVPLRTYISAGAYSEVISSCSVVIMNHLRQQALGNIILALCSGARVFLQSESPVYRSLCRLGITPHDINGLALYLNEGRPTPDADVQEIRTAIESKYGRKSVLERTRRFLNELQSQ